MRRIITVSVALIIASCGGNSSKSVGSAQLTEKYRKVKTDSPELMKFKQLIKGQWGTKGESMTTSFFDDFLVDKNAYGSDTSYYMISYKSCESDSSTKEQTNEIIYLKRMSKENGESCFSIENLNDTSLTLMSLANGSIWNLTKQ
jgi:hypothetical protein